MNEDEKRVLALVVARKMLYSYETTARDVDFLLLGEARECLASLKEMGFLFDRLSVYKPNGLLYTPTIEGLTALWS